MKKMVAVGLVGLALGLIMPGVVAQAPEVQKWEQFCEQFPERKFIESGNASMASHGKKGFQLVSGAMQGHMNSIVLCYRRPAR